MSDKKKNIILLALLVALIAAISFASAFEEDFSLFSAKKTITSGNCRTYTDLMSVQNTGEVTSTYAIDVSGSAKKYSTIANKAFILNPGETQIIYNYMNFPCDSVGDYDLTTKVRTTFGLEKEFERAVIVKDVPTMRIAVPITAYSACSCTPVGYSIRIDNSGESDKSYSVSVEGEHKQYASLSESNFMIAGGDNFNLFIYITEPCYFYGKTTLEATIKEIETGYVTKVPLYLETRACYDYSVNVPTQISTCNDEKTNYPIIVRSESDIANTYTLYSKDISLDTSKFFLWGREAASINGSFTEVAPGEKNMTFSITGSRGEETKEYVTSVSFDRCHSANVFFPDIEKDASACTREDYDLKIKNDGSKDEKYDLTLLAPNWTSLVFDNAMSIPGGEERNIEVHAEIPCDASGDFDINVEAKIANRSIKDSASLRVKVISLDEAHKPKIIAGNQKLNYDKNEIVVGVKNTGSLSSNYEIGIDAPLWITTYTQNLTVSSQETQYFALYSEPDANVTEGDYQATINVKLDKSDVVYSKTITITLFHETLWQKIKRVLMNFFNDYWLYVLAGVLLALLIIGLIIAKRAIAKRRKLNEKIAVDSVATAGLERKKVRKSINWSPFLKFLKWLLIALLVGGLLFVAYSNKESISKYVGNLFGAAGAYVGEASKKPVEGAIGAFNFLKNELPKTKSIIYINTTGLDRSGNLIKIRAFEKVSVPITIQNNDNISVRYNIGSPDTAWIRSELTKVDVPAESNKSFLIEVFADKTVPDGIYEITTEAVVTQGNISRYSEGILLEVEKVTPFAEKYMYYFIAGILITALIVATLSIRERKRQKDWLRLRNEKSPFDLILERKLKRRWLFFVLSLVGIVVAAGLVIYAVNSHAAGDKKSLSINGAGDYRVEVGENDVLTIKFANTNSYDELYFIEHTHSFIEPKKKALLVSAGKENSEELFIGAATPGEYRLNIEATKKDRSQLFSATIVLDYKVKRNNLLYYLSFGIFVVALGLLFFVKKKKNGNGLKVDDAKALKLSEKSLEEELKAPGLAKNVKEAKKKVAKKTDKKKK